MRFVMNAILYAFRCERSDFKCLDAPKNLINLHSTKEPHENLRNR